MGSRRDKTVDKPTRYHAVKRGVQGKPFDAARRAAVVDYIEQGASMAQAARLAMVDRGTIIDWLKSGRSDAPKHPEHRTFALQYAEAEARGTFDVLSNLKKLSSTDTRAALAVLSARDVRYGAGQAAARTRQLEAEAELAEVKLAAAKKALEGGGAGAGLCLDRKRVV